MKHALCVFTRLSYASCIYTFLSDVFKLLTLTIAVNISKDQVFYMLKPMLFCIADINQTFCELKNRRKDRAGGRGRSKCTCSGRCEGLDGLHEGYRDVSQAYIA